MNLCLTLGSIQREELLSIVKLLYNSLINMTELYSTADFKSETVNMYILQMFK